MCTGASNWSTTTDAQVLQFLGDMAVVELFTPGRWRQIGIAGRETDRMLGDKIEAEQIRRDASFLQIAQQGIDLPR